MASKDQLRWEPEKVTGRSPPPEDPPQVKGSLERSTTLRLHGLVGLGRGATSMETSLEDPEEGKTPHEKPGRASEAFAVLIFQGRPSRCE